MSERLKKRQSVIAERESSLECSPSSSMAIRLLEEKGFFRIELKVSRESTVTDYDKTEGMKHVDDMIGNEMQQKIPSWQRNGKYFAYFDNGVLKYWAQEHKDNVHNTHANIGMNVIGYVLDESNRILAFARIETLFYGQDNPKGMYILFPVISKSLSRKSGIILHASISFGNVSGYDLEVGSLPLSKRAHSRIIAMINEDNRDTSSFWQTVLGRGVRVKHDSMNFSYNNRWSIRSKPKQRKDRDSWINHY